MKVGIVGIGNMGSILSEAFLQSKAIPEDNLNIYNRTISKAHALQQKYPLITVSDTLSDLIINSSLIFICVRPSDMHPIFNEIKNHISPNKCVVSITSPISVQQIESILPCSVARFIPSITNKVFSGISLLTFGASCSNEWKETLKTLGAKISEVLEIDNEITRVASDIVSCGPAFFSYLAQKFIDGATSETSINHETATILTEKMLIGLGDLLKSGQYTLPTLQEKVCVKGGITGEGIKVLEAQLGDVFQNLYKATHQKFQDETDKFEKQFLHEY